MNARYEDKRSICIVGPYPPPIGGCSVHVRRLRDLLMRQGYVCRVLDPFGSSKDSRLPHVIRHGPPGPGALYRLVCHLHECQDAIVHVHVASMGKFAWIGHLLVSAARSGKAVRLVLTIHSGSFVDYLRELPRLGRLLLVSLVRRFDFVIVVNESQREILLRNGMKPEKMLCCPAYLPFHTDKQSLDSAIAAKLSHASRVILSSGYGIPLYGYEQIIQALSGSSTSDGVLIVLSIYNDINEDYVRDIQALALGRVDLLITRDLGEEDYQSLLLASDVYVRATDRDGDSLAVREALSVGVPVIASDAVPRPDAVTVYRHGDIVSLRTSLEQTLTDARTPPDNSDTERNVLRALATAYGL